MSKSRRLSEQWYQRGLWLVSVAFALCLVGFGSLLIADLPQVERRLQLEDFLDQASVEPLRTALEDAQSAHASASSELDQLNLKLAAARSAYNNARETFTNWLDTRKATNLPSQDDELIARTSALDALKAEQENAERAVQAQKQKMLDARQSEAAAREQLYVLRGDASERLTAESRKAELRVFGYRLALTLPLLLVAFWLFRRHRKGSWWPFSWGFIFFALFTFFVELVPYLPSYGGYVRYGVGLVLTVVVGRSVIIALNNYLARQKAAERQPDELRRNELNYDTALGRLAKGVCPGCERAVNLSSGDVTFCPHCGIGLFENCRTCNTRKSAFSPFCQACGVPAAAPEGQPI
ncbi:serine endopeptidase [Terrihabitans sp. B22-R8]|uniref:serine endopeptidase n=1 Tax=Terrihabitans sp. B22-R8 TaxID=3425128 RepID=UPI00403C2FAD